MTTWSGSASLGATPAIEVTGVPDVIGKVEGAVQAWVIVGSGLDAAHVIWSAAAAGGGPVPVGTFISMRLKGPDAVSDDWLLSERVGNQVVHHSRGTRHLTLELTCISGGQYGSSRAQMILARVTAALILPSVRAALRAGDVGVGTWTEIRQVDARRGVMFDPRAVVEIDLHIKVDVAEVGGEWRTVNVTTPGPIAQTVTHL